MDKLGLQNQPGRSDRTKVEHQPGMADIPLIGIDEVDMQVIQGSNSVAGMLKEKIGRRGTGETLGKITSLNKSHE